MTGASRSFVFVGDADDSSTAAAAATGAVRDRVRWAVNASRRVE